MNAHGIVPLRNILPADLSNVLGLKSAINTDSRASANSMGSAGITVAHRQIREPQLTAMPPSFPPPST